MHIKKHLGFNALRSTLSERFNQLEDKRQNGKVKHTLHDCLMSGFAMMFFQDSSLLQFQRRLEDAAHHNNLRNIFQVQSIPKDTQMRDVIDSIDSKEIEPLFEDFFRVLQRGKHLESYRVMDDYYLISIDGSGYFSSDKISCPCCLWKESKGGKVRYEHQIVQAAMMHPGKRQVIPLAPEAVKNIDGTEKQDCEVEAGKRLIKKIRRAHPKLNIIIVADSLYSKQPFIESLKREGMSCILVAKPEDHKMLMEWVGEQKKLGEVSKIQIKDNKGRLHVYEWINKVPLNGREDAVSVNYFEYWLFNANGKEGFHNSWVTDIPVSEQNIEELVRGGRSRWKIENEVFNTLKNQGYEIEHNYGHGDKYLSMNFFLLNLLAFFFHQIFELTDDLYQRCRMKFSSKRNMWECLREVIRILLFPDWETLLKRVISPMEFL